MRRICRGCLSIFVRRILRYERRRYFIRSSSVWRMIRRKFCCVGLYMWWEVACDVGLFEEEEDDDDKML